MKGYIPLDNNVRERERERAERKRKKISLREERRKILYWFLTFLHSIMEIVCHYWMIVAN